MMLTQVCALVTMIFCIQNAMGQAKPPVPPPVGMLNSFTIALDLLLKSQLSS